MADTTLESFRSFPDSARIWLFASTEPLPAESRDQLLSSLSETLSKWKSHGAEVASGAMFLDEATLMVVGDFGEARVSGCSIDRTMASIGELTRQAGVDLSDTRSIRWWDHTGFHSDSRERFAELAKIGAVDAGTIVLDLTRTTLGEIREGRWKLPAGKAWHRRAFELATENVAA